MSINEVLSEQDTFVCLHSTVALCSAELSSCWCSNSFVPLLGVLQISGCRTTRSDAKCIKSICRSALTDEHLQLILTIGDTHFESLLSEILFPRKNPIFFVNGTVFQKFGLNYDYIFSLLKIWEIFFFSLEPLACPKFCLLSCKA